MVTPVPNPVVMIKSPTKQYPTRLNKALNPTTQEHVKTKPNGKQKSISISN